MRKTLVSLADKLSIDPDSDRAPYDQIRLGILGLISTGDLLVGERLPTVRALAADLGLAANTVARSYRELETAEVIETRGRQGSFVRATRDDASTTAQRATIAHVKNLRELGIDDNTIVSLVQRVTRGV